MASTKSTQQATPDAQAKAAAQATPTAESTPTAQPTTSPAQPLPTTYEAARDELVAVVERLEAGGLSLDESLTLWERGQALAAACENFLAGARSRVEAALAADGDQPADGDPSAE